MYFPQVRSVRDHPETRFAVRAAFEHSQREDVHFHMVLVFAVVSSADPDVRAQV